MNVVNGVIQEGVTSMQDLFVYFGVGKRSDGIYHAEDVMLNGTIQPMAKCKPIHYNKMGKLTDSERRGALEDINNGVIYGLKVSTSVTNGSAIHQADWSYVGRPKGGIDVSPFRPTDFWGYANNAFPTLAGSGISNGDSVKYDVDNVLLSANLIWNDEGNTTGIDLREVIFGAGVRDWDYENMYVYIIIDDMATMMHAGMNNITPILYEGIKQTLFFCPTLPTSLQNEATRTITIAVGEKDSRFENKWSSLGSLSLANKLCTIYGLINKSVSFVQGGSGGNVNLASNFTATRNGDIITMTWEQGPDFDRFTKRIGIFVSHLSLGGGGLGDGSELNPEYTTTIYIDSNTTSATVSLQDVLRDAGLGGFLEPGDIYNIMINLQYYNTFITSAKWIGSAGTSISIIG